MMIVARMSVLPLRHKIAAVALSIAVIGVGLGSRPIAEVALAMRHGVGATGMSSILPAGLPGRARVSSSGDVDNAPVPGRELERVSYSSRRTERASQKEQRSREEALLALTIGELDQKAASLEEEHSFLGEGGRRASRRAERAGEQADERVAARLRERVAGMELKAVQKQRGLLWARLEEERKEDSTVPMAALDRSPETRNEVHPGSSWHLTGVVHGSLIADAIEIGLGLVCGVVYLGVALRRFRPVGRRELAALQLRSAVPVLGSVARIRS